MCRFTNMIKMYAWCLVVDNNTKIMLNINLLEKEIDEEWLT